MSLVVDSAQPCKKFLKVCSTSPISARQDLIHPSSTTQPWRLFRCMSYQASGKLVPNPCKNSSKSIHLYQIWQAKIWSIHFHLAIYSQGNLHCMSYPIPGRSLITSLADSTSVQALIHSPFPRIHSQRLLRCMSYRIPGSSLSQPWSIHSQLQFTRRDFFVVYCINSPASLIYSQPCKYSPPLNNSSSNIFVTHRIGSLGFHKYS